MERFKEQHTTKWQNRYSDAFKEAVIQDFLTGTLTRREVERKYKIGNSRLTYWLKEKGYTVYCGPQSLFLSPMSDLSDSNSSEKEQLARLKKELEDAKLLAESYKKMIEIAEKDLKISIRKKSNTK